MQKTAKDKIKSKINEIEAAINDGDYALDENIKMVKSNMESAYSNLSSQIQKTNVSLVMNFEKNKCLFPKGIILLNFQARLIEEFTNESKLFYDLQSKIAELEVSLNDGDHALDEKIKMVKSTFDLTTKSLITEIQRTNVSFAIK